LAEPSLLQVYSQLQKSKVIPSIGRQKDGMMNVFQKYRIGDPWNNEYKKDVYYIDSLYTKT